MCEARCGCGEMDRQTEQRRRSVPNATMAMNNEKTGVVIRWQWLVLAVVGLGLALRLGLMDVSTLHPDEALYAAYGLHIYRTGDFLLLNWSGFQPDKHPLFFWILAGFIAAFGVRLEGSRSPGPSRLSRTMAC